MEIIAFALLLDVQAAAAPPLCLSWQDMVAMLSEERAQRRRSTSLDEYGTLIEFWASDATGDWTMIITQPTGVSCEVFKGQTFEYTDEPLKRKPNS